VGVLDRFEKGIERAVNGAFAKAFRSEVQPVEIASALRRECDDKAAIDKKSEALMAAASNIAQQAAAAQGGAGAGPEAAAGAGPGSSKGNDDAVDAEFEEVKDKKKA